MPTPQISIDTPIVLQANTTYALPGIVVQLSWQSGAGGSLLTSIDGTNFSSLGTSAGGEVKSLNVASVFVRTSTPNTTVIAKSKPGLVIPDPLTIGRINITDQLHLTNSSKITATNSAGTADMTVVSFGPTDVVKIGDDTTVAGVQLHAINTVGLWAGGGSFKWATDVSGAWYPGAAYDIGLAASNHVRNIYLDGFVSIGASPASTGAIRITYNQPIVWRNSANNADALQIKAQGTGAWTLQFPNGPGTLNQVLSTDGSGITFWATVTGGGGGTGDVVGPGSSVDSSVALFSGTTGKLLKDASQVTVDTATGGITSPGYIALGTNPATTGIIRLPFAGGSIQARNSGNTADYQVIGTGSADHIAIGVGGNPVDISAPVTLVGAGSTLTIGVNPALSGTIRLPNAVQINWRNAANTADIAGIYVDGNNALILGTSAAYILANAHLWSNPDNTNDLGGSPTFARWRNVYIGTSISIGTNPATTGAIRLANNQSINWRNQANTADLSLFVDGNNWFTFKNSIDTTNHLQLFGNATANVFLEHDGSNARLQAINTSGYLALGVGGDRWFIHASYGNYGWTPLSDNASDIGFSNRVRSIYAGTSVSIGTNPATTGAIRLANNQSISWRNAANSADIQGVLIDNTNKLILAATVGLGSATLDGSSGALQLTSPGQVRFNAGGTGNQLVYTGSALQPSGTLNVGAVGSEFSNGYFANSVSVSSARPKVNFIETDAPTDQKQWNWVADGQQLFIEALTDAGFTVINPLQINRSGDASIFRDIYEKQRSAPIGHWIQITFNAANFTSDVGAWTVGGASNLNYMLIGKTIIMRVTLVNTTVSGSPTTLSVALPAGITAVAGTSNTSVPMFYSEDGTATYKVGIGNFGGTKLNFFKDPNAPPWTNVSNGNSIIAVITGQLV